MAEYIWIGKVIYRYQIAPNLKSSKSSAELGRTIEEIYGRGVVKEQLL